MENMNGLHRTHGCGTITEAQVGQEVTLCGWVDRRRDHGGLIFIDLRDRSGMLQVVASPDHDEHPSARRKTCVMNTFCAYAVR